MQLAVNLVGVMSQTLLRRADGTGRVAAYETLVGVPAVRNLIREAKTHQIASMIQTGSRAGMITLDQSMANLVKQRIVAVDEARNKAQNPRELEAILAESATGGGRPA
jgi:twitching motility protein PilT